MWQKRQVTSVVVGVLVRREKRRKAERRCYKRRKEKMRVVVPEAAFVWYNGIAVVPYT